MIAKSVSNNYTGAASFIRLANYITGRDRISPEIHDSLQLDHQRSPSADFIRTPGFKVETQQERVAYWSSANYCSSSDNYFKNDYHELLEETALVHECANASVTEKNNTYHLVVSFAPGELPDTDVMADIEDHLCRGLGFEDHQRVTGVHFDKAHLHIHIAINQINPETLKRHVPWYDKYKLNDMSSHLEHKHGLYKVNHQNKSSEKNRSFTRADDIKRLSGNLSFCDWLQPKINLTGCKNWKQVHAVLSKYNVALQPRGAGLVFRDMNSKIFLKASAISRDFSMGKLEKMFGPYEKTRLDYSALSPKDQYIKTPIGGFNEKVYSDYYYTENAVKKSRLVAKQAIDVEFRKEKGKAFSDIKIQKDLLKPYGKDKATWNLKTKLNVELNIRLADIDKRYNDAKFLLNADHEYQPFLEYVEKRAKEGDIDALNKLKEHFLHYYKHGQLPGHNGVAIIGKSEHNINEVGFFKGYRQMFVSKYGMLSFRFADGSTIATGKGVVYAHTNSDVYTEAVLRYAANRFKGNVTLSGNQQRIADMVKLAKQRNLKITINGERIKTKTNNLDKGFSING